MISVATIALATLLSVSNAQSSVNTVYNLTLKSGADPTMTLEYSIDNTTSPIRLNQTIRIRNFNTSSWNTGTGNGMYVGLGYGCDEMSDCDMTWCTYNSTSPNGAVTDKFFCFDVKTNSTNYPVTDTITNDVYNVTTLTAGVTKASATAKYTVNNFDVRFVRPFRTNDTADY